MSKEIIAYFAKRHILTNLIFLVVLIGGVFAWTATNKEEMPDVTFERVRISVRYPGAPAGDVEYFIAKPIEEKVRGLDGVYQVTATCSVGQANVTVELEQGYPEIEEAIAEIRNAVLDIRFPAEVVDDPVVRVFRTSKKAILDIALYHTGHKLLDIEARRELQKYAFALENRLLSLSEVNSVNKRGYLREEIQIRVYPEKLRKFEVPFNAVMREVRANNIRQPAGALEAPGEPKVTLLSELNSAQSLRDLIIQGGFDGKVIRLGEAADIVEGYEKNKSIAKVNGYEAVMFNVIKNGSSGILESLDAVRAVAHEFEKNNLRGTPIKIALLDDESIDVRNRLRLVGINGAIGFVLILAMLFVFLDKRSGIWVTMCIPFTLCFTMIGASLLGFTINGTTLAAVIIVMGIVVDDSIVVAENIIRKTREGLSGMAAVVEGTSFVLMPIVASITTTCVAFIPLFFFSGHFGRFVSFIPPIIFLMLVASLLEALIILPGHMGLGLRGASGTKEHWFDRIEARYGQVMEKVLAFRGVVFAVLIGVVVLSGWIAASKMKFVLFPNEETRDLVLTGMTPPGSTRFDTARRVQKIEDILLPYVGREVVGFRTNIAQSRRGGAVQENRFRMLIEIVPKEERDKSADDLVKEFRTEIDKLKGFSKVRFRKSRWGHSSGSPIELFVGQNNDALRKKIVSDLVVKLEEHPDLTNVEVDEGLFVEEYRIKLNREKIKRLSISPGDVASTFRAALEGIVLYEFSNGDEEVRVRLTTVDAAKTDIERVLDIPVENGRNYLVPLRDIVTVEKVTSPNTIARREMKRTITLDADLEPGSRKTPVEVAEDLEANIFPEILSKYPTTTLSFGGEVKDTRESRNDFRNAAILALLFIYGILAVLFDSTTKPILIMLAIPLGIAGIIIAFYLHGKLVFGFYAAVGALGLAGVVINDAIIMLVKLDDDYDPATPPSEVNRRIARIAQTRLRAVVLTTLTTVAGVLPTAYGLAGYDAMLAEMMLALAWGMIFGTVSTLVLVPCLYRLRIGAKKIVKPAAVAAVLFVLAVPTVSASPLTMEEFVQRAVRADTEFEEILVRGLALRYEEDLQLPARDVVLSVRENLNVYLPRDEEDLNTIVGLSKLFPMTGTNISADYAFNPTANSSKSSSDASLTIAQPIAENAFGRSTRLLKKIVGLEVQVSRFQITEAYEDYMASIMSIYVDWFEAYENLKVGRSSFRENEKLLDNINSRRRSKIAKAIDVNKITLQVLAKKEKLVDLEEKYKRSINLVNRVLRREALEDLVPERPSGPLVSTGTFTEVFSKFQTSGRTYRILRLLERKSGLELAREADDLLPSIDLLFTVSREGNRTDFKNREDKVIAGLSLKWPLTDQRQRAEHRTARIERERVRLAVQNTDFRLKANIRNLYQQIEREHQLTALAEEKISLAESILQDESENYTFAKASLNDYIVAVNRLDSNRFNQIRRMALLRNLSIEWLRLTDNLVTEGQLARPAFADR